MEALTSIYPELLEKGVFVLLFVALLVYVIKTNEKREAAYQLLVNTKISGVECSTQQIDTKSSKILETLDRVEKKADNVEKKVDNIDHKFEILSTQLERE